MNAIVSPASLATRSSPEIIEHADGAADFVVSQQCTCHYDADEAILWSVWAPRGIPSFNSELLHDLERASQMIEGHFTSPREDRPLDYMVLRSAAPRRLQRGRRSRLLPAADRRAGSRAADGVRARRDQRGLPQLHRAQPHDVTTVALLEGDALGGGFECALSCDVVIAEKHVKAGFPEVLFNMFPGMGGMSFLARRVGRAGRRPDG